MFLYLYNTDKFELMKKLLIIYSFLIVLILLNCFYLFSQSKKQIPQDIKVSAYVTDKTNTLKPEQINSLEQKLSAFEKETSNQIVVWMEPSLEGNSLEDRSFDIAEKNGIGQKGKNNGVLLYIAKDDRKLRIEVGYGLEGVLTDALCSQIIRNEITPQFKKGNFYEGIDAGVDAIINATKGEYKAEKFIYKDNDSGELMICCIPLPALVFFVIFAILFFLPIILRVKGVVTGNSKYNKNWWYTAGSGWSSGSTGGFSSSGFSGGGGSFGGGGASGSW